MQPGSILLLVSTVALVFATGITALVGLGVGWALLKLRPIQMLEVELSGQRAMLDALEAQIIKLRTQKAGARSVAKREAQAPAPPDSTDDPLLEGLSEEERALFM